MFVCNDYNNHKKKVKIDFPDLMLASDDVSVRFVAFVQIPAGAPPILHLELELRLFQVFSFLLLGYGIL